MTVSPALALYLGISALAGAPVRRWLRRRAERGKEDPARLHERIGKPTLARSEGKLLWLHGASIGECMSMLPLIDALRARAPALNLLVTSGTVTSARRMAEMLPEGAVHQFVPADLKSAVRGFLDHWRPDAAIWIESEIWPRLMVETGERGIPMLSVNARVSEKSARKWRWAPGMARALLRRFAHIYTQDRETIGRLQALGLAPERMSLGGNLKVLAPIPPHDPAELAALREEIGSRPVWLGASTHPGEEEVLAEAQARLRAGQAAPLLILAPRHPERGDALAEMLAARGFALARRSRGERPEQAADVFLADTLGEMGLWFRLAPVSFVGGSLVPAGGHTPFEPVALGSAVLTGPQVANFAPAYAALFQAGGARQVAGAAELATAVEALLAAPEDRRAMVEAASAVRDAMVPETGAIADHALRLMREAP